MMHIPGVDVARVASERITLHHLFLCCSLVAVSLTPGRACAQSEMEIYEACHSNYESCRREPSDELSACEQQCQDTYGDDWGVMQECLESVCGEDNPSQEALDECSADLEACTGSLNFGDYENAISSDSDGGEESSDDDDGSDDDAEDESSDDDDGWDEGNG